MATSPSRMSTTLPANSSTSLAEDGRKWSSLDAHQQGPEPFQSIPAQELLKDSCSKCGWIRKEGGSVKSWRDRYIILHKGCMYYYNTPDAKTTAGKFSLSGYRLSPAPEKTSKFQWTFKLVHLQPEKRTYYFAAYSEQEMNEWMNSIVSDMREYCGTGRQSIIKPGDNAELEYCYPEVEPKFDLEQLATMFENPQLKPALEIMYCPPPEMGSPQVQRKPLPPQRPAFPSPKLLRGGFTYTDILTPVPGQGGALFGAVRKSREGRSLGFPRKLSDPPALPARKGKPLAPPKPLPRPPPLTRHTTEPIMRYPSLPCRDQEEEEEEGEGYLDIVPDTNPEDVNEKQPALSRGCPDGQSIERYHTEIVLPSSAVKLDVDKMQVGALLENKLGVYILRRSQNAQSERALSVWTGDRVRHYMVFQDENQGYALQPEGPRFDKLEEMIEHYHDFNLPKCDSKLTRPFRS
ncbi:unnamed protein product [Pocillopora meandrina]|uniref:SH3 domain-binding protein 2 n=1 Tax=Pocillopora meandrina TaxID=46732 RepID=A0AAU9XP02_9CNID|nr:unnamed protein product [Pocillopora meandrina]